jgi:phosphatidylglycerol:prolipoprotein diacylglycerol transferase
VFAAPQLGAYLRVNGAAHFRDGLPIFGYGFMLFLGMASALWLATWRAEKEGVPADLIWDLAFFLFIVGIAGGRLFYLVQKRGEVFANVNDPASLLNAIFNLSQGGLVLYGGLLGGAAAFFTFCHLRRIPPLGLLDIITPSIFVGIGFGRIGCFLNGCCYGDECSLPWAVSFPRSSATFDALLYKDLIAEGSVTRIPTDLGRLFDDGVRMLLSPVNWTPPLHPTQLYSALDGFLIAALTFWYFRHRRRNGECFAVALMIYPVTRFVIEILRNDEGGQLGTTLTISQWVSITLWIVNIGFLVWLSRRPAVREPVKVPELAAAAPAPKNKLIRSSV